MRNTLLACIAFVAASFFISDSFAGEKEDAVIAGCASATGPTAVGYLGCVAAGLTGNEITTCATNPSQCYGPNNELRKAFCALGVGGCPKPPEPAQLIRMFPYHGGCEVIYNTGIYFSPDCQNLRGGGNTVNAWAAPQAHWEFVRAMVLFQDCIITAFNSAIYRSCNGINLGGGGETKKLYEGAAVESMDVVRYNGKLVLRTKFHNNPYYCDPSGYWPAGGEGVDHCDHGTITPP
jgi:hypothetical protein